MTRLLRALGLAVVATLATAPAAADPAKAPKPGSTKKAKKKAKKKISKAAPDVQLEVRGALLDYSKALAAHDWQKASGFYTDDATLWGNRKLRGKDAIVAWLKDFTSLKMVDMTLRDTLVRNVGDGTVTVLGHWDSTVAWEEKGKLQSTSAKDGSFLYVMIKQGPAWKVQTALVARKSGVGTAPAVAAAPGKEPPKAEPPSEQPKPEDDEEDDEEEADDAPKSKGGKDATKKK